MCEHYYDFKKRNENDFWYCSAVGCIFFASAHNASKKQIKQAAHH